MTILFINSIGKNKWGEGEKWIVNTATGLQALGHKVIVGARKNSILYKHANDKGMDTMVIGYHTDFSVGSSIKLAKYINNNNVQIVVASLNRDVSIGGFAALLSKHKPKVIRYQEVQLTTQKRNWKPKFTFKKLAHGIITNSKSVHQFDAYLHQTLIADNALSLWGKHAWLKKIISQVNTFRYKNSKPAYYLKNYLKIKYLPPFSNKGYDKIIKKSTSFNQDYIDTRLNYYNKLNKTTQLDETAKSLKEFVFTGEEKTYFFDTWRYTRLFKPENKFSYKFGDVTTIPDNPSIVKSRPIGHDNQNSILLNLNYIRHFIFVNDPRSFLSKKNLLVWRGNIWTYQPHRIDFFHTHFHNPICNIGHVNKADFESAWHTDKLSIDEQLEYKFILSIEGNDVATNLKWIMSSNSIAVMPTPKFETWFMEGTLKPDYHYIHIKDDYSDLNEKLNYYINHPDKAEEIRSHANEYVNQFKNKTRERLISILVLKKYFEKTK